MARVLAAELAQIRQIRITQKVESNGVFAILPKRYVPILQKKYFFYVWNEATSEVRFMTSFDTTAEDIKDFVSWLKKTLGKDEYESGGGPPSLPERLFD